MKEKIEENLKRNGAYDPTIVYDDEFGKPTTFDLTVLPVATPLFSPRMGLIMMQKVVKRCIFVVEQVCLRVVFLLFG